MSSLHSCCIWTAMHMVNKEHWQAGLPVWSSCLGCPAARLFLLAVTNSCKEVSERYATSSPMHTQQLYQSAHLAGRNLSLCMYQRQAHTHTTATDAVVAHVLLELRHDACYSRCICLTSEDQRNGGQAASCHCEAPRCPSSGVPYIR